MYVHRVGVGDLELEKSESLVSVTFTFAEDIACDCFELVKVFRTCCAYVKFEIQELLRSHYRY
jgi:hypothetical protein